MPMDPFSISAGSAGLLSLGIQVVGSLIEYYDVYKSMDRNVERTVNTLRRLSAMFDALIPAVANRKTTEREGKLILTFNEDELVTTDIEPNIVTIIESHIEDCRQLIGELDQEVRKLVHPPVPHFMSTVNLTGRKLVHPLRPSTLEKLEKDLAKVKENLQLALSVLQIDDSAKVQHETEVTQEVVELVRASHLSSEICLWLKAPDATSDFVHACSQRHPATGLWFVKSAAFTSWLEKTNSFLWLNGFAGSGKSVLSATAIQHALRHRRSNPRIAIAFYYFSFKDDARQDAAGMIRALVMQLSDQLDDSSTLLTRLRKSYLNTLPPMPILIDLLHSIINKFEHVYVALDALDESPRDGRRQEVLSAIATIRQHASCHLHLLVTSRDVHDIRKALNASLDEDVRMKNDGVDADIAKFVYSKLNEDPDLENWLPYKDKIELALRQGAKGVFRWVDCQFKSLADCPETEEHLDEMLNSLPSSLDETYERMLMSVTGLSRNLARQILVLLYVARRPLTTEELIEAAAVDLDRAVYNRRRRLMGPDAIIKIFPGFVEISKQGIGGSERSVVQIAHYSVQEYLESSRVPDDAWYKLRRHVAQAEVSRICLTYLFDALKRPLKQSTVTDWPLIQYAASSWASHLHEADAADAAEALATRFLQHRDLLQDWCRVYRAETWYLRYPGTLADAQTIETGTPLYYASLLGLKGVVQILINGGFNVGETGGIYGFPLQGACRRGHKSIVQLLLDSGADVNCEGGYYGTALQAASFHGDVLVVQSLLERDAQVDAHGGNFGTALQAASARGHQLVVQLLLDKGAKVNALTRYHGTALQAASTHGHVSIVQLLLRSGAEVNVLVLKKGVKSRLMTALDAAKAGKHETVVQLLRRYRGVRARELDDEQRTKLLSAYPAPVGVSEEPMAGQGKHKIPHRLVWEDTIPAPVRTEHLDGNGIENNGTSEVDAFDVARTLVEAVTETCPIHSTADDS